MMINSFDINPLTQEMHLKELDAMARQAGGLRDINSSRPRPSPLVRVYNWCRRPFTARVPVPETPVQVMIPGQRSRLRALAADWSPR